MVSMTPLREAARRRLTAGAVAIAHGDRSGDYVGLLAADTGAVKRGVLDGRRDHGDFRRCGAAGNAHEMRSGNADLLEPIAERLVAVNGLRRLGAAQTQVA